MWADIIENLRASSFKNYQNFWGNFVNLPFSRTTSREHFTISLNRVDSPIPGARVKRQCSFSESTQWTTTTLSRLKKPASPPSPVLPPDQALTLTLNSASEEDWCTCFEERRRVINRTLTRDPRVSLWLLSPTTSPPMNSSVSVGFTSTTWRSSFSSGNYNVHR